MVAEQAPSRKQKRVLDSVIADIAEGQSLSKSLGRFPNIFGDFAINIIKVGESSGILSQNLEYLADELKKKDELNRKIIGASVYPAVIGLATVGITIFLMVYLFPKITPIFSSLNMTLPLSTRIVMAASNALIHDGLYMFGGVVALVICIVLAHRKFIRIRYAADWLVLKMPVVGTVATAYCLANGARTLGLLLKSGITPVRGGPADGGHHTQPGLQKGVPPDRRGRDARRADLELFCLAYQPLSGHHEPDGLGGRALGQPVVDIAVSRGAL